MSDRPVPLNAKAIAALREWPPEKRMDISIGEFLLTLDAARSGAAAPPLDEERLAEAVALWWGRDLVEHVNGSGTFSVTLDTLAVAATIAREYAALGESEP